MEFKWHGVGVDWSRWVIGVDVDCIDEGFPGPQLVDVLVLIGPVAVSFGWWSKEYN